MRAILIDPFLQLITEVQLADDIADYYRLIGCERFAVAAELPNGDDIFVDDEGLLKGPTAFFGVSLPDYPFPFAGRGLVVGKGQEGEALDAVSSLSEIATWVAFGRFVIAGGDS